MGGGSDQKEKVSPETSKVAEKQEIPKDDVSAEYVSAVNKAQYAIDNLEIDWKANALAKAKSYQSMMDMYLEAIRDQLTSFAGEQFTEEEADYAIEHLND